VGTPTAFGLDIDADRPLPFLGDGGGATSGRELRLRLAPGSAPDWPSGELICDERRRDGGVEFQIEACGGAGYRIHGPRYGASEVAADGQEAWGRPGDGGMVAWQRLLVAQSLPFVAVLRGLEAFHASAVVLGSEAVALTGPSGSGKTSLALALQRRGAEPLADDVLAVELVGGELIAHPGAAVTGVDRAEVERLRELGEWGVDEVLAENEREVLVRRAPSPAPVRLGSLFLLDRRPDGPATPRFEPAVDAKLLLASTFNLLLASPARLTGQLEICAELARRRVERLSFGPGTDAQELTERILSRVGEVA
jgi:hypothetical protein